MARVVEHYVLVKQTSTTKDSVIIRDAARSDADKFDNKFEIVQLGEKVERNIKVGEAPIFAKHVQFQSIRILEKTNKRIVAEVIVHEGDIIGIDDEDQIDLSLN